MRWLFGLVVLVFRGDQAKDAELLVLRHENAVLRQTAGQVRYEPADRAWFAALAPFIPRRRWARIFPVTPATLLAWHRRPAARKYDTSTRRRPGAGPEFGFFEFPAFTASSRIRVTLAVSSTRSFVNLAPSPAITDPAASANRNASA